MNNPETEAEASDAAGPVSASASVTDPYAVLRNRDFTVYLTARFLAALAQQMLVLAVGWEIYERTGRSFALGMVGLVQVVPMFIFIFPAGHVADNYNRKQVILWMQLALAVVCAGLTLVSRLQAPVWLTYCCLFALGTARTYLWPASQAFMPQLVPREQFARAVAYNTGSFQIAAAAGPAAAGAWIGFVHSAVPVYAFASVSMLVCFIMIGFVRSHQAASAREPMSLKSVIAGLKFVYRTKIVLGSITLDMFAVLLGGATAMLPIYAKDILKCGADGLGLLQAALPLGSLAMAGVLVHLPPMQKAGRTLLCAVAVFGVATIAFGLSHWFWFAVVMMFVCGAADYISVVIRHTLVQLRTPDEMRGRVSAVNSLFIGTSNQMGDFESGFVASLTNPVFAVVSGGIGTLVVVASAAYLWPEIRRYGRLDT
jgi:MFS family permease